MAGMGLQKAFLVATFAGLAQVLTFLVFVKWGSGLGLDFDDVRQAIHLKPEVK